MAKNKNYAIRPDAQPFDEIRITTIPRFKTSGMSGDEWRISAKIQFFRKGRVVHEDIGLSTIKTAIDFLPSIWHRACDEGKGFFAGEEGSCDQEGCKKPPTVFYQMKNAYCQEGHRSEVRSSLDGHTPIRKFCDEHKVRGDCGLDDADSNYEKIEMKEGA